MAIAFDATSNSGEITDSASPFEMSWSHTCTGTARLLVVAIAFVGTETINSVTYNGVAMTLIDSQTEDNGHIYLFYLANPASGANTVLVTVADSFINAIGMAVSLTGVDQTSPLNANNKTFNDNTDNVSTAVTTTENNCWTVDGIKVSNVLSGGVAVDSGQTQRQNTTPQSAHRAGMSTEGPITPAGSTSMGWNDAGAFGTRDWAHVVAAFRPNVTDFSFRPMAKEPRFERTKVVSY